MTNHDKRQPNPSGEKPSPESPNEPSTGPKNERQVSDPHPDTEEGYGRKSQVPMTGL